MSRFIRVKGQLYERAAVEKFNRNPGIAIIDPSNLEVQEEHYKILARAIMVAFASAMVAAGIKKPSDLVDYREEDLVVQIPKILQKLNQKSGLFRQEMMRLRSKGPELYAKDAGRELSQIR